MRWELVGIRLVCAETKYSVEQDESNPLVWHVLVDDVRTRFFNGLVEALQHAEVEAGRDWLAGQRGTTR